MFGFGMGELVVIFLIVLILFGGSRLPQVAQSLGKTMREVRKFTHGLKEEVEEVKRDVQKSLDEPKDKV